MNALRLRFPISMVPRAFQCFSIMILSVSTDDMRQLVYFGFSRNLLIPVGLEQQQRSAWHVYYSRSCAALVLVNLCERSPLLTFCMDRSS
jgi:hypothetical protein